MANQKKNKSKPKSNPKSYTSKSRKKSTTSTNKTKSKSKKTTTDFKSKAKSTSKTNASPKTNLKAKSKTKAKPKVGLKKYRYFITYKPYGMLSQFTDEGTGHPTLADLEGQLPKDVYAVGRLDRDSEGLLLLTNDMQLRHELLDPKNEHEREYWVQVEGLPTWKAITQLNRGVTITVNKKDHDTLPTISKLLAIPPKLPERNPPIRQRELIPTCWMSISLIEGKNRQVRKMTAKVGHPTLRLVRARMEDLTIEGLEIGKIKEVHQAELYRTLGISNDQ